MTFAALVRRNLLYHWRGNVAVFLGIALGSAVLTGALLVGDSLRGSLRDLSLSQLGWIDETLAPGRFFSQSLADAIPADRRASVLMLGGSASYDEKPERVVSVNLFGVTPDFWTSKELRESPIWKDPKAVVLNEPLARDLGVKVGDTITLNLLKADAIPRETLLGKRKTDAVLESLSVKVAAITTDAMARFALRPTPEPARNAFVPLSLLQKKLELGDKINAVLLSGVKKPVDLGKRLTLRDWGLKLSTPDDRARNLVQLLDPRNKTGALKQIKWEGRIPDGLAKLAKDGVLTLKSIEDFYNDKRRYLLLQSDHFYLDSTVEAALKKAFDLNDKKYRPSLIYLADTLTVDGAESPYATIAAVVPDQVPGDDRLPLDQNQIRIVDWPGSPLPAKPGLVQMDYYVPDAGNHLVKRRVAFSNHGSDLPLKGEADDPDWTPEYPGLTDKLDIASWENPPFPPYSTRELMKRIKPADEEYWKRYRATPKAYITLAVGQKLFGSRFGDLTQLRIDVPPGSDPSAAAKEFEAKLLAALDPSRGGFVLQDVRGPALLAAAGTNDFGMLFLAFSFFLIVSALMLVGLLVRLNLERRAKEIGLLAATGWGPRLTRRLLRREGWILIVLGSAAGLLLASGFAWAMLRFLAVNWPGQGTLQFLVLHVTPKSYAIGFAATVVVSALTLRWAFRMLRRLTPTRLLAGETSPNAVTSLGTRPAGGVTSWIIVCGSLTCAVLLLVSSRFIKDHEALAGAFFGGGLFMLIGLLSLAWRWLHARGEGGDPQPSIVRLAVRNAGRNPVRSLLTIGLLATTTFMVVAVQAFHREPTKDFFDVPGGGGGFRLIAQTDVPLFQGLGDKAALADVNVPDDVIAKIKDVVSCRIQPGDDTSCLNLYKPLQPRVVGLPTWPVLEKFAFAAAMSRSFPPGNRELGFSIPAEEIDGAIPAVIDANTAQWVLKVGLGDIVEIKNQAGEPVNLKIVGLLKDSLFQSEILVSEKSFLKLFPAQQGYQLFLIDCSEDDQAAVMKALITALASQGGKVQPTIDRLASYLAVENTYLATFQALGGLGLLLGAVGLAIVLVRGVWERRAELALLRAVGFRRRQLAAMILAENGVLLILGLGVGCLSALAAIAPHLVGGDARLVWGQIALLLGFVAAVGLGAGALAVAGSLKTPTLDALRRE